jgi:hypothetical protein
LGQVSLVRLGQVRQLLAQQQLVLVVELLAQQPEQLVRGQMQQHHRQLLPTLLRREQSDQSAQQSSAEFLRQVKESLYQLCQLKLLEVAHQHLHDHLRLLTNE